jgi:hypothetical protein
MLRAAAAVQAGDRLDIEFHDGRIEADALSGGAGGTGKGAQASPAPQSTPGVRRTRGRGGSNQGSLF